jgi:hypothetical protein
LKINRITLIWALAVTGLVLLAGTTTKITIGASTPVVVGDNLVLS